MTRQTRVGLVVAGSFLCAVGGYMGLRLRNMEPPADTPNQPAEAMAAVVQPQPAPTSSPEPAPMPPQPVLAVATPEPQPAFTPPPTPAPEPVAPPPMPITTAPSIDPPLPQVPSIPQSEPPKSEPIATDTKPPEPQPETPKPIAPLPEFKAVDTKPELPTPPIEPAPKETAKPDEPKPMQLTPGSASLTSESTPPRPLPDQLPNVQPAGATRPTPKAPSSDSYLEEEYRLQSGDTFASVSKRFYFTDKYSIALQQYNREYPIGASNLKVDPPRLTAGTVVWIPPIRVLEKRYPTMIADYKPLANAAVAGPATAAAPAWTGAPARQIAATTKTYRVRDGGESMQDIARRSLGHPLAWNTIHQLNPSLNPNPTAPIPAGTLLRIPGDARD